MKRSLLLLLVSVFLACRSTAPVVPVATAPAAKPAPVHLVIVSTTDVHGHFDANTETTKGKTTVHYGGAAILGSYLEALRVENPGRLLVVDSGDLFQGTLESNLFEGQPVVEAYNALGYTAAAVGNHEFDYGPAGPSAIPRNPGDDPVGALKVNAARAHFPFLSANMVEKATGKTPSWAKPSILVTIAGTRVGIVGLSTPDTPNVTMIANVEALDFTDPVAATIRESAALRAQGADVVIVIAHMGGRCTDHEDVHDVASCEAEHEVMRFLKALPAGTIDAYFAGHTHAFMRQYIENVPVLQATSYSREFATLDMWVDPASHRVDHTEMRPHTMLCTEVFAGTDACDARSWKEGATMVPRVFLGRTITPNAAIAAIVQPYLDKTIAKKNERPGITLAAALGGKYLRESELGDLLTDAIRKSLNVDVAMLNSGGIRASLPAGELTYGQLFEVSPFDNYPAIVTLTGKQLVDGITSSATGERGIMQVSGLKYTVDFAKDANKPAAERNRVVAIALANGDPIDPAKLYKVAMPDFVAAGGDGWNEIMKGVPHDRLDVRLDLGPLREVIISQLKKEPQPIPTPEGGRITVLNDTGK